MTCDHALMIHGEK